MTAGHVIDVVLALSTLGLVGWVIVDETHQARARRRERVARERYLASLRHPSTRAGRKGGRLS